MKIGKSYIFEAAHCIPGHPTCGQIHGHSWTLTVEIEGGLNENKMVIDFNALNKIVRSMLGLVDHKTLSPDMPELVQNGFKEDRLTAETLVSFFLQYLSIVLIWEFGPQRRHYIQCRLQEGINGGWAEEYKILC